MAYRVVEKGQWKDPDGAMVYCDTSADMSSVDTTNLEMGTMLYIIDGTKQGAVYMLRSNKTWIEQL